MSASFQSLHHFATFPCSAILTHAATGVNRDRIPKFKIRIFEFYVFCDSSAPVAACVFIAAQGNATKWHREKKGGKPYIKTTESGMRRDAQNSIEKAVPQKNRMNERKSAHLKNKPHGGGITAVDWRTTMKLNQTYIILRTSTDVDKFIKDLLRLGYEFHHSALAYGYVGKEYAALYSEYSGVFGARDHNSLPYR